MSLIGHSDTDTNQTILEFLDHVGSKLGVLEDSVHAQALGSGPEAAKIQARWVLEACGSQKKSRPSGWKVFSSFRLS